MFIGFFLKTKTRRWAFFSENPNKKEQTTNQQSKQLNKKIIKTSPSRGSSSKSF